MNNNMTGLRWFSKIFASICLSTEVASALEGVSGPSMPLGIGISAICAIGGVLIDTSSKNILKLDLVQDLRRSYYVQELLKPGPVAS